jgi:hypothetical protein
MTDGYPAKHYSISLPADAEDKSLAALFHHVGNHLAKQPIQLDEVIAITFAKELPLDSDGDSDSDYDADFTIVWN